MIPAGGLGPSVSADFSYSKSSYHQGEADPTPTITGTPGGAFICTSGAVFVDTGSTSSSTGQIDLDASTIDTHLISYTVDGVTATANVGITASPFLANTYSMQFDGVNDYIDLGNILNFERTDAFSISAWCYFDATGTMSIFSKLENTAPFRGYSLFQSSTSVLNFYLTNDNSPSNRIAVYANLPSPTTSAWKHIIVTYDGSSNASGVNFYVNGSVLSKTISIDTLSATIITSTNANIGARAGASEFFNGKIDEVAIWNTALSSDAVQEIYDATNNNTGKALDLNTDSGNYTNSSSLQYWNRLGD